MADDGRGGVCGSDGGGGSALVQGKALGCLKLVVHGCGAGANSVDGLVCVRLRSVRFSDDDGATRTGERAGRVSAGGTRVKDVPGCV